MVLNFIDQDRKRVFLCDYCIIFFYQKWLSCKFCFILNEVCYFNTLKSKVSLTVQMEKHFGPLPVFFFIQIEKEKKSLRLEIMDVSLLSFDSNWNSPKIVSDLISALPTVTFPHTDSFCWNTLVFSCHKSVTGQKSSTTTWNRQRSEIRQHFSFLSLLPSAWTCSCSLASFGSAPTSAGILQYWWHINIGRKLVCVLFSNVCSLGPLSS